jgi:hypothetical protein
VKRFVLAAFWLCVISCFGCAASLPTHATLPDAEDKTGIEAAIYAWRLAGLPWAERCDDELARVRVVVTGPAEFTELCGRKPVHAGGSLYACNTEQYERAFPYHLVDGDRVPLLVISELQPVDHRRLLVIHETMHWLERCSGKGIDFDHEDARVWHGARLVAQRGMLRLFASRDAPASASAAP